MKQVGDFYATCMEEKAKRPDVGIRTLPKRWSGTPDSNRRPSPWQGEQATSPSVSDPHQPSPTEPIPSGTAAPRDGDHHQGSPTMHNGCVPQVFQDGARPLDVAQVAVLLSWTKDAVRAACQRGVLEHVRDHLNAYRIPCSAVAAAGNSGRPRRALAREASAQ